MISSLAGFWARIPRIVLFGAAAVVQVALLTVMIVDRVQILRDGKEVTLQSRPVDPRDLLRGQRRKCLLKTRERGRSRSAAIRLVRCRVRYAHCRLTSLARLARLFPVAVMW